MATIIGTNGNNVLNGGTEDDLIFARGGADTVTGGDGNDVVYFEATPAGNDYFDGGAGDDGVLLDVNLAQFIVSPLTAANSANELILYDTGSLVTLTVTNVEKIGFLDAVGWIVGFGSEIAGIQSALNQTSNGDFVAVQGGAYVGNFSISTAVIVQGVESNNTGVSVSAASGNVFSLSGNLGSGEVELADIAVTGGGNGIVISSSTQLGSLLVDGMAFSGLSGSGIITGSGAPGLDTVIITDTTFDGVGATGAVTASNGGSIVLYGFNGDATISDVTITNALTESDAVNVRPDYAIHITGYDPATYDVTEPAGTIAISDVTIEGTFHKNAISIQGFTSLSGITFDNVEVTGASAWGYLVFIDPIASDGAGTAGVGGYPGHFAGGEATSVIDLSGLTVTNLSTLDVGFDVFVRGTDAADTQTGTEARDVLNADAEGGIDYGGNDVLFGMGGDDTLFAGLGSDTLDGGDGIDTAVYTDSVTDYTVDAIRVGDGPVTGFSAVDDNSSADHDTLTSVEIVQFADAVLDASLGVQMFDAGDNLVGTFATIQEAVDVAADGYSIMLATGTYQEQVTVDGIDNLTIAAFDGADVTILAPADVTQTATSHATGTYPAGRAVNALVTVLNSTGVTIEGITIDGAGHGGTIDGTAADYVGVFYQDASGGLEDVDVIGIREGYAGGTTLGGNPVVSGNQRGVGVIVDNGSLMGFFMHGGSISDFQKNGTSFVHADLDISGVAITGGGAQTIIAQNGIQARFSTGTIDDVTITEIGYAGSADATATSVLLYGNTNLDVTNNNIVGANLEDTNASSAGIYVLDFGSPSYTNSGGSIAGNDISYADYGIDVVGLVSPDSILVEDNTFSNLDTTEPGYEGVGLYANPASPVAFEIEGSDFNDNFQGAGQGDTFDGLGGNDTFYGAGGDDTFNGGAGDGDTAFFDGPASGYDVQTVTDANGFVVGFSSVDDTDAGNGDEGTDTLTGVEKLNFDGDVIDLGDSVQLFDGTTLIATFDTIQEAVDAAVNGNTILLAEGTYSGNVTVNKDVTIGGPNAGDPGSGVRGGEAVIDGLVSISANGVTLDGVTVSGGAPLFGGDVTGLYVTGDNVTLTNLILQGDDQGYGIVTPYGGGTTGLVLSDSLVTGWDAGAYFNPSTQFTVSGNSFDGNGNGFVGDDWGAGTTITDNAFTNSVGAHIGYGSLDTTEDFRDYLGVDNTFDGAGRDIGIYAYGDGTGGQELTGTDLPDSITGEWANNPANGNDTFHGLGGDDRLNGGAGDDTLDGGAGNDTLIGGSGVDTAEVGTGASFDADGTNWMVTSSDGTDTLTSTEIVEDGAGNVTLLVGSGGFATIQDAVDASGSVVGAVTILVADGTYAENVVIDRGDLTLVSVNGRGAVTIGDGTGSGLGAIEIDPGVNNVTIGGTGQGFTIIGLNGNGASESGAVYLQGAHDGISVLDNEIVANGDAGLMGETGYANTNILIDGNEFSGQTFVGAQPGGEGFATQFDVGNNVPRQLVVLGNGGSGPWTSNNITFTNNLVSGTAGGISSSTSNPQGNTLVTIDAANSLIADNVFTGFTDRFGVAIRARGPDTDILDNTLSHIFGGQSRGIEVNFQGTPGSYSGNIVYGAATADTIFGMTPGADIVNGNGGADVIAAGAGNDQLFGGADADALYGEAGNDLLDGGTGNDTLTGGLGNDTYRVDAALDAVVEAVGEGTDTIETYLASYVLGANLENLTYLGAGNFNGVGNGDANIITGGNGADRILAGAGNDTLIGLDGNDRLFGHGGTNTLVGGNGDDYYNIISATDVIVETIGGGSADVAVSSKIDIDLSLYDNVEEGRLVRDLDLDVAGSSRADRLYGNSGDNTVTGGAGRDVMVGGAGADVFVFNSLADMGATNGTADRIGDFDGGLAGIDLIDLHHIDARASAPGNNAFVWIGTDAFSGHEGELRYSFPNGVATTIQGDVNGDGIADFVITLTGNIDLYDGNFLL